LAPILPVLQILLELLIAVGHLLLAKLVAILFLLDFAKRINLDDLEQLLAQAVETETSVVSSRQSLGTARAFQLSAYVQKALTFLRDHASIHIKRRGGERR
jgi:hypothetical protein